MSHFAEIDENGEVLRVIVAEQDFIDSGAVGDPSRWIQTSYNASVRKNYAGIGYKYNREIDAFIRPAPYESWILDKNKGQWKPPKENNILVNDDESTAFWDENLKDWIKIKRE